MRILNRDPEIALDTWGALTGPFYAERYRWVSEQPLFGPVLDAGCGQGYEACLMALRLGEPVVVLDIEPNFVALAERMGRLNKAQLVGVVGSAYDLPFPEASFRTVTAFEMLEHLDRPEEAIAEYRRVLVPGGSLLVSTPQRGTMADYPGHVQDFSARDLVSLLDGFEVEAVAKGSLFQMIRAVRL